MVTIVVILVAIAAFQGVYNLVKEAHHDFPLIDPADDLKANSHSMSENSFDRAA